MAVYKIEGAASNNADVHLIQDGSYFGSKAVTAGNYEVSFDSTTPSGLIAVAEKADGEILGYGGVIATTSTGTADLTAGGGASIESIQTGYIDVVNGTSSNTATISSVDMDKSMLMWGGQYPLGNLNLFRYAFFYIRLTDATTVTAVRQGTGAAGTMRVRYTVVEFSGGINSIQRGVLANSQYSTTADATITEVDTDKAFVNFCGWNQSNESYENIPSIWLNSSTQVRMQMHNSNNYTQGSYEVIEFE